MPPFTVTAVDIGTDTLTAVGHGLLTGDRFRVRNVGGALPTGLASVTDYFAIRLTNDTLKVAASSANAFAGTAIDITGAGSGTTTIEYGLPFCIPTALAAQDTQVKSTDANGTWNALVAIYDLLTGQAQSVFNGVTIPVNQHVTVSGTGKHKHGTRTLPIGPAGMAPIGENGQFNLASFAAGTSTSCQAPILLPVGARITAVRAYVRDSVVGPTTLRLDVFSINSTGSVGATLGTSTTSTGSGGNQTLPVTGLTTALAAVNSYVALVSRVSGTAAFNVFLFEVDYDEP